MGLFSKIKEASVNQGGVYVLPGKYRVRVESCKIGETRKGEAFFVTDLKILESDNEERPVDSHMSYMVMSSWDSFESNVKAFIMGVMGCEEEEVDEDMAENAIGEEQPLAGEIVKIEATNVKTKSGGDFTKCRWFADDGESEEQAA
jgi:hypothetical protein